MEKYFIKGTDEELRIGDIVCLSFSRVYEDDDEEEFFSMETKVDEDLIEQYKREDFIEVYKDKEEEDDPVEFIDDDTIDALIEANKELEDRTENLEEELKNVKKALNNLLKTEKIGKKKSEDNSAK